MLRKKEVTVDGKHGHLLMAATPFVGQDRDSLGEKQVRNAEMGEASKNNFFQPRDKVRHELSQQPSY